MIAGGYLPPRALALAMAAGLGLATAVVAVTVSALAGLSMSGDLSLSTVPYGFQFVGVILTGLPASLLMGRFGRRPVFLAAATTGVVAGLVGCVAVSRQSFTLLIVSHLALGVFLSTVQLYRFAVLDLVDRKHQSRAMSVVLFAGVIAAALGPEASKIGDGLPGLAPYAGIYLVIACLAAVVGGIVAVAFPSETASSTTPLASEPTEAPRSRSRLVVVAAAITIGAVGYGLMNLIMTAASLHMKQTLCLSFATVSTYIQLHVVAMFAPSLVGGYLIRRLGIRVYLYAGLGLQMLAAILTRYQGVETGMLGSLIVLGLAWNVLYLGGSHLVGRLATGAGRWRVQGINDLAVAVAAAAGALGAGLSLDLLGWEGTNTAALALSTALFVGVVALFEFPHPVHASVRRSIEGTT